MRQRVVIGCVIAAAVLWLLSWRASERPAAVLRQPATHTVMVEGMRFEPERLTVEQGDTVVWLNKDMFPHTATSKAGGFDSQQIAANASWQHRFAGNGEFPYVCTLHPTMKGTITVR